MQTFYDIVNTVVQHMLKVNKSEVFFSISSHTHHQIIKKNIRDYYSIVKDSINANLTVGKGKSKKDP